MKICTMETEIDYKMFSPQELTDLAWLEVRRSYESLPEAARLDPERFVRYLRLRNWASTRDDRAKRLCNPGFGNGGVTLTLERLLLEGEELSEFARLLEGCDGLLLLSLGSVMTLDLTVADVWQSAPAPDPLSDTWEDAARPLMQLTGQLAMGTGDVCTLDISEYLRTQKPSVLADLCRWCRRLLIEPTETGIRLVCWPK